MVSTLHPGKTEETKEVFRKKAQRKIPWFQFGKAYHKIKAYHTDIHLKMEGTDGTSLVYRDDEVELLHKLQRKFKNSDLPQSPPPAQFLNS